MNSLWRSENWSCSEVISQNDPTTTCTAIRITTTIMITNYDHCNFVMFYLYPTQSVNSTVIIVTALLFPLFLDGNRGRWLKPIRRWSCIFLSRWCPKVKSHWHSARERLKMDFPSSSFALAIEQPAGWWCVGITGWSSSSRRSVSIWGHFTFCELPEDHGREWWTRLVLLSRGRPPPDSVGCPEAQRVHSWTGCLHISSILIQYTKLWSDLHTNTHTHTSPAASPAHCACTCMHTCSTFTQMQFYRFHDCN